MECWSFSFKQEIGQRVHMEALQSIKVVAGSWREKVKDFLSETEWEQIESISILSQEVRLLTLVGCQYFIKAALFNLLRKQFILQLHLQAWRTLVFSLFSMTSHNIILQPMLTLNIIGPVFSFKYYWNLWASSTHILFLSNFRIRGLSISFSGSIFFCISILFFFLAELQTSENICMSLLFLESPSISSSFTMFPHNLLHFSEILKRAPWKHLKMFTPWLFALFCAVRTLKMIW